MTDLHLKKNFDRITQKATALSYMLLMSAIISSLTNKTILSIITWVLFATSINMIFYLNTRQHQNKQFELIYNEVLKK